MANELVYLDSYCLQNDMRIRLPKAILTNLSAEKGKTIFDSLSEKELGKIQVSKESAILHNPAMLKSKAKYFNPLIFSSASCHFHSK